MKSWTAQGIMRLSLLESERVAKITLPEKRDHNLVIAGVHRVPTFLSDAMNAAAAWCNKSIKTMPAYKWITQQ